MQNLNIKFLPDGGVWLSDATYGELRAFVIRHGETDLPTRPEPKSISEAIIGVESHKTGGKKSTPPPDSTQS